MQISRANTGIRTNPNLLGESKRGSIHEKAINKHAQHLSKEKRNSIIETVRNLEAGGESVEEVQYVIDHFFEDNGITPPSQLNNVSPIKDRGLLNKIDPVNLDKILDRVNEMKTEERNLDEIQEEVERIINRLGLTLSSNSAILVDVLA